MSEIQLPERRHVRTGGVPCPDSTWDYAICDILATPVSSPFLRFPSADCSMATGDADFKCSYSMRFVYPEGLLGRLIAIKSAEIKGRRVGQQANIAACVP
jgi:hypothetical protein